MSTGDPGLDAHLAKRREMLDAAHDLAEAGGDYFRCNEPGCGGPTVVDEDGCCVYCGVDAEMVTGATSPAGTKR